MKKPNPKTEQQERICSCCGRIFTEPPALSRKDNVTEICPECGIREALDSIGVQPDEAERILDIIKRHQNGRGGMDT